MEEGRKEPLKNGPPADIAASMGMMRLHVSRSSATQPTGGCDEEAGVADEVETDDDAEVLVEEEGVSMLMRYKRPARPTSVQNPNPTKLVSPDLLQNKYNGF